MYDRNSSDSSFNLLMRYPASPKIVSTSVAIMQERVVIVHRQEPLGGEQVRRAVALRVFVAADREELHGRPSVQPARIVSGVRAARKSTPRALNIRRAARLPSRSAVADFYPVSFVRCVNIRTVPLSITNLRP